MAKSLEAHRSDNLTSIHGRRLGLDKDGFLGGCKPVKNTVTNATSDTTGTALLNHGLHTVATTTNDTWSLTDPVPGCEVSITTITTSTGSHIVTPAAATIYSTNGVAGDTITFNAMGESITLAGLSTSEWMVTSNVNSVVVSS